MGDASHSPLMTVPPRWAVRSGEVRLADVGNARMEGELMCLVAFVIGIVVGIVGLLVVGYTIGVKEVGRRR